MTQIGQETFDSGRSNSCLAQNASRMAEPSEPAMCEAVASCALLAVFSLDNAWSSSCPDHLQLADSALRWEMACDRAALNPEQCAVRRLLFSEFLAISDLSCGTDRPDNRVLSSAWGDNNAIHGGIDMCSKCRSCQTQQRWVGTTRARFVKKTRLQRFWPFATDEPGLPLSATAAGGGFGW